MGDKKHYDTPGQLLTSVVDMLNNDDRDIVDLASDLKVNYFWLKNVASGKTINPSVNRIEYIYQTLKGKKIKL